MHAQTINIHIGRPGPHEAAFLASLLAFAGDRPATSASAPEVGSPAAPSPIPRIGAYWQGQGGIYAGVGRGHDGKADHHLIVLDPQPTKAKRALGTYGVDVTGACSDHDGMANTIALAHAGSELCAEILELEIDRHKDFYLMARTDARLCMANVPELFEKEWYLTSTQYSSNYAWSQYFDNGNQDNNNKKAEALFRPVRRLIL